MHEFPTILSGRQPALDTFAACAPPTNLARELARKSSLRALVAMVTQPRATFNRARMPLEADVPSDSMTIMTTLRAETEALRTHGRAQLGVRVALIAPR